MKDEFIDDEFGVIHITRNARAKRVIARRKTDGIYLTVPASFSLDQIKKIFHEIKHKIQNLKSIKSIEFNEDTLFQTLSFKVQIRKHQLQNYYSVLKDNILHIQCPSDVDFQYNNVQAKIKNYIESALRLEAKHIFPDKVKQLAGKYGFKYSDIKVNKSRTRWGSCSSKKNLNFSIYTLLLPNHLVNFIILHELCHTIEMNHGDRFWHLLDSVTNNQAKELTKELKNTQTGW